jgi:hypothetical protein
MIKRAILPLALILASNAANAGIVTNDTDILTGDDHAQLSEWLGEDFDLTRIFAKGVDGNTSADWHQYVDGAGPTFTVFEVFNGNDRMVVGGYNNFNWTSGDGWLINSNRDNFLFNLSTRLTYQKNDNSNFQTNNHDFYGVAFGGGVDLIVRGDLSDGYANIGHSYGDRSRYDSESYKREFVGVTDYFNVGRYETYIMSDSTGDFGTGAIAEINSNGEVTNVPASFLLGGLSLLGIMASRRKCAI